MIVKNCTHCVTWPRTATDNRSRSFFETAGDFSSVVCDVSCTTLLGELREREVSTGATGVGAARRLVARRAGVSLVFTTGFKQNTFETNKLQMAQAITF